MNIIHKFIVLFICLLLIFLYYSRKTTNINKTTNKTTFKKTLHGGSNLDCRLSKVIKHNLIDNKWVYINGTIYDVTDIINLDAVATPEIFKNINIKNVNTFVNLIKHSDLQDLHKIFKSFQSFNTFVNEYNLDENNTVKVDEFDYETLNSTEDTIQQITNKFADFKLILLISLKQFKVGTICPSGLII
jgi:hypothetical protein